MTVIETGDAGAGPREITERDISLTFAKGMSVLKAFDTGSTHLTLPQIARATGLARSRGALSSRWCILAM